MSARSVLVLGAGFQGRAAAYDLDRSPLVDRVIVADRILAPVEAFLGRVGARKVEVLPLDAADEAALERAIADPSVALVLDLLPVVFDSSVARLAVKAAKPLVTTNYAADLVPLDAEARAAGVTLMPEAGFDPGIDLVMAAHTLRCFDRVEGVSWYGTGIPAPELRGANVIDYKVSWSFAGVLRSYAREARFRAGGVDRVVAPSEIFSPEWRHEVSVDGIGRLEAFPNGDAVGVAEAYGKLGSVAEIARFTLRWPGHSEFWRRVAGLGLLDDRTSPEVGVSPREFLRRHLEPQLQYGETERDLAYLRLDIVGVADGRRMGRRLELIDYRDLKTGLLAMSRLVGYPASVVSQMILRGEITKTGVARAAADIPSERFFDELEARAVRFTEAEVDPDECFVPSRLPGCRTAPCGPRLSPG